MKKFTLALFACLALAIPAMAQEPNRLDKIEASIANLNAKLDSMSDKLDKLISSKTLAAPAPDPFAVTAKVATSTVAGCQCGCVKTGQCACKDCDHPMQEAPKRSVEAAPTVTQYRMVCGPNGCLMVPINSASTNSGNVQYFSGDAGGGGGGCAGGNCGSGGNSGRRGLFGLRR